MQAVELVVVTAALEPQLVDALLDRAFARRPASLVLVDASSFNGARARSAARPCAAAAPGGRRPGRHGAARRRSRGEAERARGGVRGQWLGRRLFSLLLGLLIAWNWGRLETRSLRRGQLALMVLLGVAPALLPTLRLRLAGAGVALIAAWSIALDVRPIRARDASSAAPAAASSTSTTCSCRSTASDHRLMHGVVLLAVFVFTALAVARGRGAPAARSRASCSSPARGGPRRSSPGTTTSGVAWCCSSRRSPSSRGSGRRLAAAGRRCSSGRRSRSRR